MKIINNLFRTTFIAAIFFCSTTIFAATFTPEQNKAIEKVVHDYLVNNPEVLMESVKNLQQKQEAQMEQESKKLLAQNVKEVFDSTNRPIAGNAKGNIVIAEMSDYRCPHCKIMGPVVEQIIKNNPDVKIIYIETPIFGEDSAYAAKAALASVNQNKFSELNAALLKNESLKKEDVLNIAKSLGIDTAKLQKDIENKNTADQINLNIELAKKLQIPGTPAFFIGNIKTKKYDALYGNVDASAMQGKINSVK
jgi:protein-disulfide isomerase